MTTTGELFDSPPLPVSPDTALIERAVTYTPNALNQYETIKEDTTVITPFYDEDGNLTTDQRFIYSWNGENRLIAITPATPAIDGDNRLSFVYDYQGRRFAKTISSWDGTAWQEDSTSYFIYDGWNLIRELDATGAATASYTHGLDVSGSLQGAGGIGGILARIDHDANLTHAYLYDANGNVVQMLNTADGAIAAHYAYDPFGTPTIIAGGLAEENPFRFSSKYFDFESGLVYYGYRYYSAELGRWVNRDPLGEDGGVNLYGFVGNDGIGKIDYLGNYSLDGALGKELRETDYSFQHQTFISMRDIAKFRSSLSDNEVFAIWLKWEIMTEGSWWAQLPRCPRKLCINNDKADNPDSNIWHDPKSANLITEYFHPGAAFEMRTTGSVGKSGNQCIYDDKGIIITKIPTAGSADYRSPNGTQGFLDHQDHDVETYKLAKKLGLVRQYFIVRPVWVESE